MCGVAGFWDRCANSGRLPLADTVRSMNETLVHRGPDAGALWCDEAARLALGHRRLSIIDLSVAGAQPMVSSCGRFVISYNGEVYNADELRSELVLRHRRFRGHSDTEVIVVGCAAWGVQLTVERLIGMFAMALWDRQERVLYLIRDRLGIKPMYWAEFNGALVFGSELKTLRAFPGWQPELDRDAIAALMRFTYVPGPLTIYRKIRKLPPGTMLVARASAAPEIRAYWTLGQVAREGQRDRFGGDEAAAVDALDGLLGDAVRRRMVADVPLGAFLSGGIDSSTVVALMQKHTARPVRTFSIGFKEAGFDEAPHAKAVANHLGTDHTELYVSAEHALEVIPRLPDIYDEPFADPSQIPTFLVSEMTRQHVTVALSGDGGDELFAGYNRYIQARNFHGHLDRLPHALRSAAAGAIQALSPAAWNGVGRLLPARLSPPQLGDKLWKLAGVLGGPSDDYYRAIVSHWQEPDAIVRGGREPKGLLWDQSQRREVDDFGERLQYVDTLTYLPDDILVKVDRASMAVSLEARVPIIDHRIVAFSWTLPPALKLRGGTGKWLLRKVLDRYVPKALTDRPKMGFGVPIDAWLRGPLRGWAEALLEEKRLAREGVFDPRPIRKKWQEHLSGSRNWQYRLWDVLIFQAWKERWLP